MSTGSFTGSTVGPPVGRASSFTAIETTNSEHLTAGILALILLSTPATVVSPITSIAPTSIRKFVKKVVKTLFSEVTCHIE